ncbi:MAG TPA: NAD(P)-binding domain-containing protein [Candidatus Magasanikbacteria bacterium]|nr:NAD(P)-binding domain-containing protein [Candidatus Magasanikbacteria bacterium]
MKKVLVIGAGKIGSAIGGIIHTVGHSVDWWDIDQSKIKGTETLEERVATADVVFLCVHSWVIRETLERVKTHLKDEVILVSVAKGFEKDTMKTADQIVEDVLPHHAFAFFGGPMVAPEIAEGKYAFGAIASKSPEVYAVIVSLFEGSRVLLNYIDDVHGTVLAGVLKNVYAMGLGMLDEQGMGSNARGWYATKVVEEMGREIAALGGKKETAYTLAGMGDFIATGMSEDSRHRGEGRRIAKGETPTQCEGVVSTPTVVQLLGDISSYPLLHTIHHILQGKHELLSEIVK